METKQCTKCGITRLITEFHIESQNKDGKRGECKVCRKEYRQALYQSDPERRKQAYKRWYYNNPDKRKACSRRAHLKAKYKITEERYLELLEAQDGKCAICHKHHSEIRKILFVDHDHRSGEIRGLLCSECNFALGLLRDSPEIMHNMIAYLQKSEIT